MKNKLIEKVLKKLELEVKQHSSIDRAFVARLTKIIEKNEDLMIIVNNKFKFDTTFYGNFIRDIDKNKKDSYYYKNFNRLKKFNLINKYSSYFPKNLSLISINPNHFSLLSNRMSLLDDFFLEIEKVKQKLHIKKYLYLYLRLFHVYPMSSQKLTSIKVNNIINLEEDKTVLVLVTKTVKINKHDKLLTLIKLDKYTSLAIKEHIDLYSDETLFQNINEYESFLNEYKKENLSNGNLNIIKLTNRNYYLFSTSSLKLTLDAKIENTVKLTVSELDKIYPNKIPEHLLRIEEEQINAVFDKDEYNENIDYEQSSFIDIHEIEELDELLKKKENKVSNSLLQNAIETTENSIKANKKNKSNILILSYIVYILKRLIQSELRLSTVKNYIGILNKHIFTKFEDLYNIQRHELDNFIQRIDNLNYKQSSTKKILRLTKSFFRFGRVEHNLTLEIPSLYYPKSLVFYNELDAILEQVQLDYIKKSNLKRQGKNHTFIILQKQVMILLGFYTGMRISELKSRLFQDIYIYDDILYIDVNSKGLSKLKLKLKTRSAKRRIKTVIKNSVHLSLIRKWLNILQASKKKNDFIFTKMNKKLSISKSPIDDSLIQECTDAIKIITQRYCTFHSLRHSFATYTLNEIQQHSKNNPYALLELSIIMGHETPRITLNSYVHYDLIEFLMQ